MTTMNTHYGLLVFAGDFDNDHPNPERRGHGPELTLLAAGPERFCWDAVTRYTAKNDLGRDECVEVVARDILLVVNQTDMARNRLEAYRREQDN